MNTVQIATSQFEQLCDYCIRHQDDPQAVRRQIAYVYKLDLSDSLFEGFGKNGVVSDLETLVTKLDQRRASQAQKETVAP